MKKDFFYEKIVAPIMRMKPKNVSIDDFLAIVFNLHTRIISTYLVKYEFNCPGLYMVQDCIPTQGVGDNFRKVKRSELITVRVDDHFPNEIHLETKGHVFLVDRFQWNTVVKDSVKIRSGYEEIWTINHYKY